MTAKNLMKDGNGNRTKHLIEGKSLFRYCKEHGIGSGEYHRALWVIKEKCMTPEEALNYHRQPKNPKWKERKKYLQRINKYKIKKEYAELPSKILIEMGFDKQSKYFYKGMRLRKYCEKKGISYSMILNRMKKHGLSVRQAIEDFEKILQREKREKTLRKIYGF